MEKDFTLCIFLGLLAVLFHFLPLLYCLMSGVVCCHNPDATKTVFLQRSSNFVLEHCSLDRCTRSVKTG